MIVSSCQSRGKKFDPFGRNKVSIRFDDQRL